MFSPVNVKPAELPDFNDPSVEANLDEFLTDPIGYGSLDWSDPISLSQFDHGRCPWFRRSTVLAR